MDDGSGGEDLDDDSKTKDNEPAGDPDLLFAPDFSKVFNQNYNIFIEKLMRSGITSKMRRTKGY